jgi:hypothetical protein
MATNVYLIRITFVRLLLEHRDTPRKLELTTLRPTGTPCCALAPGTASTLTYSTGRDTASVLFSELLDLACGRPCSNKRMVSS